MTLNSSHSGYSREALEKVLQHLPADFSFEAYPQIKAFLTTLVFQSEIDAKLFMQEIDSLNHLLAEKMAKNEKEKKIVDVYQRKILLSKLFELELTPSDYEIVAGPRLPALEGTTGHEPRSFQEVTGDRDQGLEISNQTIAESVQVKDVDRGPWTVDRFKPSVLLNEIKGLNAEGRVRGVFFEGAEALDGVYSKAMRFYEGAKARDLDMIKNVELAIKELGVKKVAVITGGFHAEPFRDYFQKRGYSYGLIMPSISGLDEEGREAYLSLMHDQVSLNVKSSTVSSINPAAPKAGKPFLLDRLKFFIKKTAVYEGAVAYVRSFQDGQSSKPSSPRFVLTRRGFVGVSSGAVLAAVFYAYPGFSLGQVSSEKILLKAGVNNISEKYSNLLSTFGTLLTQDPARLLSDAQNGKGYFKSIPKEAREGFSTPGAVQTYLIKQLPKELEAKQANNSVHALKVFAGILGDMRHFNKLAGSARVDLLNEVANLMNVYVVPDTVPSSNFPYVSIVARGLLNPLKGIREDREKNPAIYTALYLAAKATLTNQFNVNSSEAKTDLETLIKEYEGLAISDAADDLAERKEDVKTIIKRVVDRKDVEVYVVNLELIKLAAAQQKDQLISADPALLAYVLSGMEILIQDLIQSPNGSSRYPNAPGNVRENAIYGSMEFLYLIPDPEATRLLKMTKSIKNPPATYIQNIDYRIRLQEELLEKKRAGVTALKGVILALVAEEAPQKSLRSEARPYVLLDEDKDLVGKLGLEVLFATDSKLEAQLTHKLKRVPELTDGWDLIIKFLATHPGLKLIFQVTKESEPEAKRFVENLQRLLGPDFDFPKNQIALATVDNMKAPVVLDKGVSQVVTAVDAKDLPDDTRPNLLRVHLDNLPTEDELSAKELPAGILAALLAAAFRDEESLAYQNILKASQLVTGEINFTQLLAAVKAFATAA